MRFRGATRMLAATLAVGAAIAQPASAGVDMERQARKLRTENRTLERLASLDAIGAELKAMPGLSRKGPEHQARHALVIGIDDYEVLPHLRKAVGDSKTIASTLVGLGFEVTRLENLGIDAFDEALDGFYERLAPGDIAFVFYAGHGVALDGVNFLLPSDMPEMKSARSSRLERYAVDAGRIVDDLRTRGVELAFVVFDACRNNPFPQDDQRGAVAMAGLQRMTPKEGAFVIYSAGIGQTALDRLNDGDTEPNSVFTRKFWQILNTPGLPVVDIAKRTQVEVAALAASVDHQQAPAYYDEVIGQFYFQPPRPRLFGLAVGIDDYGVKRINLDSSVNDALLIGEALRNAGAVRVETLTDYNAHRDFIRYVWRDLLEEAQPGDTIVFAYSGHAAQEPDSSATPEADGKTEIMLVNGPGPLQWDPETNQVFESRKITDDELTAWMGEAADRNVNVVLLFDGCHGGGMLDREFANVSFIGSSQEDETSTVMVRDGRRHGTASLVFANAIAGAADFNVDGFVTQRELFAYVDENVFRMRERQNPKLLPPIDQSAAELALFSVTDSGLGRLLDLSVHWRVRAPKENDAPAR